MKYEDVFIREGDGVYVVARNLHRYLNMTRDFAQWWDSILRMKPHSPKEGIDYFPYIRSDGVQDYKMTAALAKRFCGLGHRGAKYAAFHRRMSHNDYGEV